MTHHDHDDDEDEDEEEEEQPVEAQAVSIPEHQLLVIAARHQGWSTRMEGKALDLAPSPSAHHTWPAMPSNASNQTL